MSVFSFKQGLKDGKLLGCICEDCNNKMLPPRMICSKCGSTKLKEHCFDGKGVIKTKTVIHVPLSKFQDIGPYTVGIIKLDEGPMITGMVVGDPDTVKIGDKVEADYIDIGEERILAFKKSD